MRRAAAPRRAARRLRLARADVRAPGRAGPGAAARRQRATRARPTLPWRDFVREPKLRADRRARARAATATCAAPRSTSRPRARTTASSARSSCRRSMRRRRRRPPRAARRCPGNATVDARQYCVGVGLVELGDRPVRPAQEPVGRAAARLPRRPSRPRRPRAISLIGEIADRVRRRSPPTAAGSRSRATRWTSSQAHDGADRAARRRRHVEPRRLLAGGDGVRAGARRRRAAHRGDRAGSRRARAARRRRRSTTRSCPTRCPTQLDWFADVPVGLSSAVLLERPDVARRRARSDGGERRTSARRARSSSRR